MNKDKINFLVDSHPFIATDSYVDGIVDILTPPKWYQFRARKDYSLRVRVVMSEYAKELLNAIAERQTPKMARPDREISQTTSTQANV